MRSRRYAFVFPAATLLLALTGQSVLGFSLTGSTQGFSANDPLPGFNFEVTVQTDDVRRTRRNERNELLELLDDTTFSQRYEFRAGRRLSGTFNIRNNTPCTPDINCNGQRNVVGSIFDLTFTPSGKDPKLSPNLYWIQWLSADWSRQQPKYEFIDIYFQSQFTDPNILSPHPSPYYPARRRSELDPSGNRAFHFFDSPFTRNIAYNNDWDFQLYLAHERIRRDATGIFREVTVYNGISWGWTNTVTQSDGGNNGGSNGGGGGIGSGGSGGGGIGGSGGGGIISSFRTREVPLFDNDFDNDSEEGAPDAPDVEKTKIEKVPEATSLFGLFALSGLGIFQWLKNRKDK